MHVLGYEKFEQCVYERSHLIVPDRMNNHLVKCRKKHSYTSVKICPYQSNHPVKAVEYERHVEECDGKDLAPHNLGAQSSDRRYTSISTGNGSSVTSCSYTSRSSCTTVDEDCEIDRSSEPYDPVQASLKMNIIRKPIGLTLSQRSIYNTIYKKKIFKPLRRPMCAVLPTPKNQFFTGTSIRPLKFVREHDVAAKEKKEASNSNDYVTLAKDLGSLNIER